MIVVKLISDDHHPDTKFTTYVRLKLESLALFPGLWTNAPTVPQMIMSLTLDPQSLPVILQLLSDENRSEIKIKFRPFVWRPPRKTLSVPRNPPAKLDKLDNTKGKKKKPGYGE